MLSRTMLDLVISAVSALSVLPGCAVTRGQGSVGAYVDDATITAAVKAKFVENKQVDATSVRVETLNGEVMLSRFAKNVDEWDSAEVIARKTKGVKSVKNQILVRG